MLLKEQLDNLRQFKTITQFDTSLNGKNKKTVKNNIGLNNMYNYLIHLIGIPLISFN